MNKPKVLTIVLAGGEGRRLQPLTRDRAKPAVPFAGNYRLIDFALSNLVNAGLLNIVVLTQYKSYSLDVHLARTWRPSDLLGHFITPVPAQMRRGPRWYEGSADAIHQNLDIIRGERPDYIVVFGADHVYRMDPRAMLTQHIQRGVGVTVAAIRAPLDQADQFGVIEADPGGTRIARFREKPKDAEGLPDDPDQVFASMGNYVFTTSALVEAVTADATDPASKHDVGGNIIPMLTEAGAADVYDFSRNRVPGATEQDLGYWRDVGNLDTYYQAHMDLVSDDPPFNLHNEMWPIRTECEPRPPAKFVTDHEGEAGRAADSIVCPDVIISGAEVRGSVLSPGVRAASRALVEGSVLMHGVTVGRGAVVRKAIVDKNVKIPDGARIGVDPAKDRDRFHVTDDGVVVIAKSQEVMK